MALSVNKVQLIGYVGGDPTTHVATSGTAITNFSLATGESWTDKNTGKKHLQRTICIFLKMTPLLLLS